MTLTDTRPTGQVRVGPPGAVGKLRLLSAPPDSSLAAHLVHWGPLEHPDDLIAEVGRAGLRGRGGAGFPTARKLNAVRHEANGRRRAVVVANGAEGEPASAKDGVLLTVNPHLVLDGMVAAARAVGASRVDTVRERGRPRARGVALVGSG